MTRRLRSSWPGGILADARWAGTHGIGRFTAEVLRRLPVKQWLSGGPRPLSPGDPLWIAGQVFLRRPSVLFSPGFNPPALCPAPFVFTIHDLMQIETPEVTTPPKRLYYRCIVRPACRRAYRVLTVSEHSRSRILAWSGLSPERVVNVGNGVGNPFRPDGPVYRPGLSYILYVGNARPHKNLDRLFQSFARLGRHDVNLILAGVPEKAVASRLDAHGIRGRVRVTGSIPDEELAALYRGARLLDLPSLMEGFGLPVLEAMACGTPAVVSSIEALQETAGKAAVFFDPRDPADLTHAMELTLGNPDLAARLRAAGLERAKAFCWDRVAARVLAILAEAAVSKGP